MSEGTGPGPHDWLARASLAPVTEHPLTAARAALARAEAVLGTRGGVVRQALGALLAHLPGARGRVDRGLLGSVRGALAALGGSLEWQRARIEYLESLVVALASERARSWRGSDERPVFFLGTGGGGTRVLAEAAMLLGVHLGTRVNESFDSVEWAPLIYELALAAGPAIGFPRGDQARARILALAADVHGAWSSPVRRWGVKLPELMLVLPLVLDAFPAAQVVFLMRHPLAASLRRPHLTTTPDHPIGRLVLDGAYRAAGRDAGRARGDAQHVRNALAWRFQVERIHRVLGGLPAERVLRLRLEDFASDGPATSTRLAGFLGVPPPRPGMLVSVDEERASARPRDPRAAAVMAICGDLAQELGYRL